MSQTNVSIRRDSKLKDSFAAFCNDMGMTMTTAFNLFAKKAVREYRIPFEIGAEKPNKETIEAMKEAEEFSSHPENYKRYSNFSELLRDVKAEDK